jgi:hypothetical protein
MIRGGTASAVRRAAPGEVGERSRDRTASRSSPVSDGSSSIGRHMPAPLLVRGSRSRPAPTGRPAARPAPRFRRRVPSMLERGGEYISGRAPASSVNAHTTVLAGPSASFSVRGRTGSPRLHVTDGYMVAGAPPWAPCREALASTPAASSSARRRTQERRPPGRGPRQGVDLRAERGVRTVGSGGRAFAGSRVREVAESRGRAFAGTREPQGGPRAALRRRAPRVNVHTQAPRLPARRRSPPEPDRRGVGRGRSRRQPALDVEGATGL